MAKIAIVRVRGLWGKAPKVRFTFSHLRLERLNHCSVYEDNATLRGMLNKIKDYATWGEIDQKTLEMLVSKRGYIGNSKFCDVAKEKKLDAAAIAADVCGNKKKLSDFGLTQFFRLTPPAKGHGSIKKALSQGGSLGARTSAQMISLLKSMC